MRQRTADRFQHLIARHQMRYIPHDRWERMSPAEKIEALTGHSLDNCREILDLPIALALESPTVMTGKTQIVRAILQAVTRVGIESSRLAHIQDEVLEKLIADFDRDAAEDERKARGNGAGGGMAGRGQFDDDRARGR